MRYPQIRRALWRQLAAIEPSHDGGLEYCPCRVITITGKRVDCVYVEPSTAYFRHWGIWPQNDAGKQSLDISDVAEIHETPCRLPALFANQLYPAGESGMGYFVFTVLFADGVSQAYITGGAVDFIPYPRGKSLTQVTGVLPHQGRKTARKGLEYYWCLYGGIAGQQRRGGKQQ